MLRQRNTSGVFTLLVSPRVIYMNIFQKDKEHFKTQHKQQLGIDAGCSTLSSASALTIQRTVSQTCKPTITVDHKSM
jgi:hypothetical protein